LKQAKIETSKLKLLKVKQASVGGRKFDNVATQISISKQEKIS